MASRKVEDLDVRLQNAWKQSVLKWNNKNGLIPFLTCTERTPEEQNEEWAKGRTKQNGAANAKNVMGKTVTNARAYQSPHNFTPAQAFDFAFQKSDGKGHMVAEWNDTKSYSEFIALILEADKTLVSGATFKGLVDADHIETPDWREKFKTLIKN